MAAVRLLSFPYKVRHSKEEEGESKHATDRQLGLVRNDNGAKVVATDGRIGVRMYSAAQLGRGSMCGVQDRNGKQWEGVNRVST